MRRIRLSGLLALLVIAGLPLAAQSGSEGGGMPQASWMQDAPTVRVWIDGPREMLLGAPVRVRYRVSEDAYVVVARVAGDGRLTILFPQNPSSRTFVRGGVDQEVRGRRTGSFATFYASEPGYTGFVFALTSSEPLDLSRFQTRDFERMGADGEFSRVNRRYAYQPDRYIERFAAWVTYDANSEYDYDVDYYSLHPFSYASSSAYCFRGNVGLYGSLRYDPFWNYWDWAQFDSPVGYYSSYRGYCGSYLDFFGSCVGFSFFFGGGRCYPYYRRPIGIAELPTNPPPVTPVDSAPYVNRKLLPGGLWTPDTVGTIPLDPPPGGEARSTPADRTPRRDAAGDPSERLYSLPQRAMRSDRLLEERRKSGETGRGRVDAETEGTRERADRTNVVRRAEESRSRFETPRHAEPPVRERREAPPMRDSPARENIRSGDSRPSAPPPQQRAEPTERPSAPPARVDPPTEQTKSGSSGTDERKKPPSEL